MARWPYCPELLDSPGCGVVGVVGRGVVSCCAKAGPATRALLTQNSSVLYSFNFIIASFLPLVCCPHKLATPPDVTPGDRKSTRLNSSHVSESRMPSSA